MTNMFCLVGRIENIQENEEKTTINIIVNSVYKNEEGQYESDIIPVIVNGNILKNVKEYCKKGDIIGVKGIIKNSNSIELIVEKVSFLSSRKEEE